MWCFSFSLVHMSLNILFFISVFLMTDFSFDLENEELTEINLDIIEKKIPYS